MSITNKHLIHKRRRRKHYRAKTIWYLFCAGLIIFGSYYLVHQPWIAFGHIVVEGGQAINVSEVKRVDDIAEPVNLFNISRSKLENVLRNDLRVEKVSTAYAWPNILKVYITERKPAIYVECAYDGFAKVGYNGCVLEVTKGIKDASAPFVSGRKIGNVYNGDIIKDEEIWAVVKFLGKLDKSITSQIAEISIDNNDKIKIYLLSGVPILLGSSGELAGKINTFIIICNELKTKKINADYIDLTYSKPYVKLKQQS
ncbi:MAG: cell division protein FtsQ/DivIB [Acidaminococcaceae bacterium]|nr:cell division protein FtsQ/DivIB [Acidaminococcaceae bacterium]MDD4721143.1 cell division protein FtsQ/DivIB [Acidaminococcaceae bacterium]